ncbi:M15 family metallopeptidase [Psychrosphaera sp.]|nr:M15 family metallopeptidase [Psychrosphaera sp.]
MIEELFGLTELHLTILPSGQRLHKDIISDFKAMQTAAAGAGFDLQVASGFRDFSRQKMIWNNKFSGQRAVLDLSGNIIDINALTNEEKVISILTFSALPGLSRHHWGTDFDFYDAGNLPDNYQLKLEEHEYINDGPCSGLSKWLKLNMDQFGFNAPYSVYNGGIAREPWHLSHIETAAKYELELSNLKKDLFSQVCQEQQVLGATEIIKNLELILTKYVFNTSSKAITNKVNK